MSKYRKKPVVIEAFQWNGSYEIDDPAWFREASRCGEIFLYCVGGRKKATDKANVVILTPTGVVEAFPGDMIIRGVNDEMYARKPDIFKLTYEPVEGE